jgi:hypothetical protein
VNDDTYLKDKSQAILKLEKAIRKIVGIEYKQSKIIQLNQIMVMDRVVRNRVELGKGTSASS